VRHPIHKPAHPSEKCWARFATALLRKRYGVSPQHLSQEEWNALYWAIAPLTPEELRGSPFMTASGATGWCGLTAIRFAPTLNNKYYLGLALFMILIGLLHDWDFVIGRHNPQFLGIMKIRTLLREFNRSPLAAHRASTDVDPRASAMEESSEGDI